MMTQCSHALWQGLREKLAFSDRNSLISGSMTKDARDVTRLASTSVDSQQPLQPDMSNDNAASQPLSLSADQKLSEVHTPDVTHRKTAPVEPPVGRERAAMRQVSIRASIEPPELSSALSIWLQAQGLQPYEHVFVAQGLTEMSDMQALRRSDVNALFPEHVGLRNRLIKGLEKLEGWESADGNHREERLKGVHTVYHMQGGTVCCCIT